MDMRNVLNYYYNIMIDKLIQTQKKYIFYDQQYQYIFLPYTRTLEEASAIYALNLELTKTSMLYQRIILNKDHQILTFVNQIPYILLQIPLIEDRLVTLDDLHYKNTVLPGQLKSMSLLIRFDWIHLWKDKIDYFEYQIEHFRKKYTFLMCSISYFIGLGENAISYIQNTLLEEKNTNYLNLVVSHKRVSTTDYLLDYYNPMSLVIDHKTRDIAEYLKSLFYNDCYKIEDIEMFFQYEKMNKTDYRLLFGRLMFPSFYFDLYDQIINGYQPEEKILAITNRVFEYERFLYEVFLIFKKHADIPSVDWITKKFSN